jgi:hypothetical protein
MVTLWLIMLTWLHNNTRGSVLIAVAIFTIYGPTHLPRKAKRQTA